MESYNSKQGAEEYIKFINSENGQIEQEVLHKAVRKRLTGNEQNLLDAACGPGWLSGKLADEFKNLEACDASEFLISYARENFPGINFTVSDLSKNLPYQENSFEAIILNMASHDIQDQPAAFKNIFSVLKPGGKLIMTLANPYYALPVGLWKRSFWGKLFFRKPKLKIQPYNFFKRRERKFSWGTLNPYFYPLSEQINNLLNAGFVLNYFQDLEIKKDSKNFDLNYQLYRFPYILLLEFSKPK